MVFDISAAAAQRVGTQPVGGARRGAAQESVASIQGAQQAGIACHDFHQRNQVGRVPASVHPCFARANVSGGCQTPIEVQVMYMDFGVQVCIRRTECLRAQAVMYCDRASL